MAWLQFPKSSSTHKTYFFSFYSHSTHIFKNIFLWSLYEKEIFFLILATKVPGLLFTAYQGTVVLGKNTRLLCILSEGSMVRIPVSAFFCLNDPKKKSREKSSRIVKERERVTSKWRERREGLTRPAGERGERTWRMIRFEEKLIRLNGERRLKNEMERWREKITCYCQLV